MYLQNGIRVVVHNGLVWGGRILAASVKNFFLQVRLRVRGAGINFSDLLMVQGAYQEKPSLPFTPGSYKHRSKIVTVGWEGTAR